MDLTLRLRVTQDSADVSAELLPATGVQLVGGSSSWAGSLAANQTVDLPLSVRFTSAGEHTLAFRCRESGARLDKIVITADRSYKP